MEYQLPHSFMAELFSYEPETGELLWKERPADHFLRDVDCRHFNKRCAGKPAGSLNNLGYLKVVFTYRGSRYRFSAHRVIFFMQTGRWPFLIDHADGNPSNNAWSNLREATYQDNCRNRHGGRLNKSGLKWVQANKNGRGFSVRTSMNGKAICLGTFATAEEAHASACAQLSVIHGEFFNCGMRSIGQQATPVGLSRWW